LCIGNLYERETRASPSPSLEFLDLLGASPTSFLGQRLGIILERFPLVLDFDGYIERVSEPKPGDSFVGGQFIARHSRLEVLVVEIITRKTARGS
jgi:hypothetical protein